METKHTKGEWIFDREDRNYGYCIKSVSGNVIASLFDRLGNNCFEDDEIEMILNARLIAAAPELLEALQEFVDAIDTGDGNRRAYEMAKSAIKKATS